MPYVRRSASGAIESVHRALTPDAVEYLDAADREIAEFIEQAGVARTAADTQLSIVLEEAFDALLAKGVLSLDELSPEARSAWLQRQDVKARAATRRYAASGFVEIIDDSAFGALSGPDPQPRRD